MHTNCLPNWQWHFAFTPMNKNSHCFTYFLTFCVVNVQYFGHSNSWVVVFHCSLKFLNDIWYWAFFFHMIICCFYIFGEMFILFYSLFFLIGFFYSWVLTLVLLYCRCQWFISYVYCKYYLPINNLYFFNWKIL